jgi:tetratricopeptide (TPR) repeat protein
LAAEPEQTPSDDEAPDTVERTAADEAGADTEGAGENRRARRAALAKARKQRMRERKEAEAVGLDAQEVFDEALVRSTDTVGKFLRRNSTVLQGLLATGLITWAAWGGYGLYRAKVRAEASDAVAKALAMESGKIGDPEQAGQPDEQGIVDPSPVFKDDEARLTAAREALQKAAALRENSGTAHYARLALASVLFDMGKLDEAIAAYQAVETSDFGKQDPELRGRALEGVALALERKGDQQGALARYQELVASGTPGFVLPALLDQARLQHALGKSEEAKATLKQFRDEFAKTHGDDTQPSYLSQRAEALTREVDPVAAKELSKPPALTPERLKQLQEQVQKAIGSANVPPDGVPAAPPGDAP